MKARLVYGVVVLNGETDCKKRILIGIKLKRVYHKKR